MNEPLVGFRFEDDMDNYRFRRYERLVDEESERLQVDARQARRALRRITGLTSIPAINVDISMARFQMRVLSILREVPNNDRRTRRRVIRLIMKLVNIDASMRYRQHLIAYLRAGRPFPRIPYVTRDGRHNRMLIHLDNWFFDQN